MATSCRGSGILATGCSERSDRAALIFGFSDSLQIKLSILHVPIPGEFLQMAPYLVTIFVVAGAVRKSRAPAADGQPYVKE
jgi:ABC-type uncharacterized transport system permease subunit